MNSVPKPSSKLKKVLIIQPGIRHYRVPFYNTLERARPDWWNFSVTFDASKSAQKRHLFDAINENSLRFHTHKVRQLVLLGRIEYQTAWMVGINADLIIATHATKNIVYLTSMLHKLHGTKFAWWGHGRDHSIVNAKGIKAITEWIKSKSAKCADGYFAYTHGVRNEMIATGLDPDRVFALQNTIDIDEQRRTFEEVKQHRYEIRSQFGINSGYVLLFVGRFTTNKRIAFLLDAFKLLRERRSDVHLFLVGGGGEQYDLESIPGVKWFGSIEDHKKLAPIYVASDLFAFPGAVGLGPLQAMCYDLPVITIDSAVHMPEVEYLTSMNSIMLPRDTDSDGFANALHTLLNNTDQLDSLRTSTWDSIRHLTIDNMTQNFVRGVNTILGQGVQ